MTNLEKYEQIFIETFQVEKKQLNEEFIYQSISSWDSVGHMGMIAQIEEAFDIMMETDDILDFTSYKKGKEILAKYNIAL